MKTILRTGSILAALGFALATLLQSIQLISIPGVSTAALVGGLAASCILILVLGDYSRKPAFRVRRTSPESADAGPTVNRPVGQAPDWTYTTRVK
jgi:hypothetical protein